MTKAFKLNFSKKALFFCIIFYEKRPPKLVRQPLLLYMDEQFLSVLL